MPYQNSPLLPQGLGQPHIFHTDPLHPSRINVSYCIRFSLFISFRLVLGALFALERLSSAVHEHLCRVLALSPSQVHGPNESAIVIVGGDDDIGRHIALDFSELGYTVFALCPDRPAPPTSHAVNVSSLIQEWHQQIKRSGTSSHPWGLVAPIVLDIDSGPQRVRAFETVDAYCATHSLHLVAVIVHPAPNFITFKPSVPPGHLGLNIAGWGAIVCECLVNPISVVQDYVGLLAAASGRVILLSASGDQAWMPSLHKSILLSAAQFLGQELRSMGIRVTSVVVGPSTPVSKFPEPMRTKASSATSVPASNGHGGNILNRARNTIEDALRDFAVRHEDVRHTLEHIMRSRYPRARFVVGLHAKLQGLCDMIPTTVHLCLQSITSCL